MANSLDIIKSRRGSKTSLASASISGNTTSGGMTSSSDKSALSALILSKRKRNTALTQPTLTPAAQRYAANNTSSAASKNGPSGTPVPTGESSKNRGGLLGGIGYVGEKIGLGFMQGLEGVVDYVGAGIAELFGNDEASERIISNDWMNYSHADEWFNPGEGWRIAGDVGGGIGTSLPGLAAGVAVTWATGGSGIGAGIGLALSGFSAAGTSTKEAYLESGELGGKEFGYGAAMGVVEAATEKLSGSLGKGLLRGIDDIAGAFGKTASKTAKALTVKTVAKDLGGEFLSEAFEEGFAEFVSPYAKRLTYDPNAKNATIEEISYAALVGGLSGLAMGGGRVGVTQLGHNVQGNKAVDAGRVTSIMDTAKAFSDYEGEHPTKLSSLEAIRDLYTRLDAQGVRTATELTGNQRRALGELQALTTSAVFEPAMQKSALSAIAGADAIAEKLNADGNIKIVDGRMQVVTSDILAELQKKGAKVRDITAEDIRGGVDVKDGKSIEKAMKEKDVLRYVVASDVAGRFLMTAKEVETAARAGTKIKSQADLNAFIENASEEQKRALGAELGIADNEWATLKLNRFNEAAAAYRESGKLDAKRAEMQAQKEKASAVAEGNGQSGTPVPTARINAEKMQVSGGISPSARMSMDEITDNPSVAGGDTSLYTKEADAAKPTNEKVVALKERLDAKKIDSYAAENIEGYSSLGEANKSMIRQVVREGRATGISDEDTLRYARVAAKTGVNVTFDKQETYKGKNEVGEDVYHAAVYDPENNRIIVNPETKKKHTVLLMHELSHAMRKYVKGGNIKYAFDEDTKLSKDMWKAIEKYYAGKDGKLDAELALDEASAYYAEALFGTDTAIDLLLGKKQTLKEKILSFFAKSAEYYSSDSALSREARRQFRKYKKMFDSFAERNQYRNAEARVEGAGDGSRRASFSSIAQTFYGNPTMSTKEFLKGNYREQIGYKKYVEQCLNNYKQTRPDLDEATARREIEDAIGGIVEVAVAAKNAGYDIFDDAAKREVKDSKKRLLFSSLEPNSDYFTSSDISTICDKRINFAEIYDDIVRKEEALGVPRGKRFFDNVDNYFYIHKVLADKGLTQPCNECYVESMRKNLAPMATSFLELINEADADNKSNKLLWANGKLKENNAKLRERVRDVLINEYGTDPSELTVEDVSTEKGLATLKITMPLVYEAFNSFYGQAKPKMPRAATPFRFGELTALLTDNKGKISKSLVDRIYKTGGFRLQSYSDFQTQNFVDVLQTIFEAGSLGLTGHAYTKVPAFLDATAGTNLKRNISIFMYRDGDQWRIDKNDSFPMSLEDIYKIVKADKSGNTGIIAVSQNAEMSAWIMANDEIAYGIPFHKSGLKMKVVRDTVVKEDGREIKGYTGTKDHTKQQTEVWKSDQRNEKGEVVYKKGTKVKAGISIYDGFWDFENKDGLSKRDLIRKNLEAYIDECEKRDYVPKFREYLVDNAKVLEDTLAYAKQLGFVKADATVDDISFKHKGYTVPYGYYKFLGDYTMFTADGKASAAEVLSLKEYDFKKAVKYFSDAEALRREEILRQFANGETRDAYRASTMTAGELENIVKLKRDEVVGEIVNKSARRAAMEVSSDVASKGRYTEPTDIKTIIKDIEAQNEIENMMPEGLSKDFVKAIKRSGGFARPRLYRGMEAAELDSIIENGYIKSNSSYNFTHQQGQTRFTPKIQTALSYATGFAPAGIREKFYEQGMPAYIVEIGNYTNLGIKNEDTIESYTVKNVDKKYITRVIELMYDAQDNSIKATDIEIDGMNAVNGETVHGIPAFMRDSVTGTILYEHQDEDGFEDGKYISEKNPDILFDYDMVESYKESAFDYNSYLGISGDKQNLVPYGQDMKKKAVSFMNELSLAENVDRILHMGDNEALANKKAGSYISISKSTPSFILEKVKDAKNLELIMRFDSFYLATRHSGALKGHYHNYGKIMSELPEIISRPLAIVRMNDGRLNILSEIKTAKGNTSIVSVELSSSKDINGKNDKYNVVVTILPAKDNYVKNNLENRGVRVEYEKEDLPQVNNQLHKWLATINGKSSKVIVADVTQDVNTSDENSSKNSRRASMDISPELEADEFVSPTEGNVGLSRFEKADVKLGDKIKDTFTTTADKLYIDTVDELYGVEKYLKTRGKMKDANAFTQSVRAAETMAQTMIGVAQYDITDPSGKKLGDGLTKIFKKYKLRKIDGKFNDYLLHQLNVDRMTLEERSLAKQEELRKAFETAEAAYHRAKRLVDDGKRKTVPKDIWNAYRKAKSEYENYEVLKNKPVFGENEKRAKDITAEESRKIIAEYEKRYPEFKESAEAVWAYSRNLQAMRVAAGLLSQESADIMAEYYPHYVPSFRDKNGGVGAGTVKNDSQLAVNSTVKSAKGGGEDVYDVEESIAIQTRQTIKAIKMNQLANAVYDAAASSGDTKYVLTAEAAERIENAGDDADIDIDIELTPKNNQIVFYRDGKKVAMNVSEEIFKGFKGVTEGSVPDFALARLSSKVLGGFKNLVTQYSPAFAARNFIRDMQDAMINTKHPKGFATHIKDALMGMANNNERWQLYLAYGGFASTVFDAKGFQNAVGSRGFEELKKLSGISAKDFKSMAIPLKNLFTTVGNINSIIEQLTRFTEFNASLDAGDSIEVAINNSAEVTTNFSRHGTMVKKLNATVIPFLNASVQGFDKMLRVISGPFKEKSLTALAILLAKIVAIGITPQILNMIMNGDDEDYNDLTDEVKSNYFLIKVGDQFIKIPRGRLAGAFGGFVNQMRNVARGEDFDAEGYAESIVTNLTPVDSFSRDIFSPFRDVASNTTWYGGEIEGRQFDGVRPSQRYDESTSSIAIALGKAFNYSPKKIHYLLDQYSGVIGDFLLPATTKKAEKDYFSGNFLLDPKTNNKLSDQFYKLYDEAQYAKNEGNVTAYYQLKHLNDVKESVSELYDEITRIQNSDLANAEKLQQVRTIRTLINNLYKTAKADYGAYTQAIEATEGMFDESDASQQRLRHTVITQMMYGSEKALEVYNKSVYEKAVLFNKAGLDYDTYYEYYFTTRGIESDVDRHGEVVAGSKKKKTLAAIRALGVSQNERLLLTAAAGYALSDGEKRRLLSHIMRLGVSKEEKAAIAEACGFKVKNGRISMK